MNQLILDKNWIRSGYGFAVTALDRLHNESLPGTIQWLIPTKKEYYESEITFDDQGDYRRNG